jgi:lipid II:glycine glycyltransferase (peptidoglycan interpeptide bridge formation enzyme)
VNIVYREVINWAQKMGYHFLDLGTYTLNMEVNYGLCRFKESFSARGQFRNTFTGRI